MAPAADSVAETPSMIGSSWTIVPPAARTSASGSAPGRKRAMTPIGCEGSLAAARATSGETVGTATCGPAAGGLVWPGLQLAAVIAMAALATATVIQRQLAEAAEGVGRAAKTEVTRTLGRSLSRCDRRHQAKLEVGPERSNKRPPRMDGCRSRP